jgi:Zn-dependent peptidase ImmA (M78 family)
MLIIRGERGAIGYNSAHARVRQRFTIAHEIAHFLLHAKRAGKPQLFIDGYMSFRRDATSSTGAERDEVEANQLGAALLMPRSLIKKELLSNDLNLDDEESIAFLAKRFQVSTAAMSNRLLNLNVLR